uniref:Uncharacterized protein n=1 Tax=Ciona intestinalis TaxID=7719 RepID=H2XZF4_CIOIN
MNDLTNTSQSKQTVLTVLKRFNQSFIITRLPGKNFNRKNIYSFCGF